MTRLILYELQKVLQPFAELSEVQNWWILNSLIWLDIPNH